MSSHRGPRRKNRIAGQFSPRTIEMMESPPFRVLSLAGNRVLARIEIELAHHGGNDNGRLPVTFDHFAEYGIHRHAIAPALREVCALGFVEITEPGRAGNAEFRRPSLFRLTYRYVGNAKPTDEWRRIRTKEEAKRIAQEARTVIKKTKLQCRFLPILSAETIIESAILIVLKPALRHVVSNPSLPLYSRVGVSPPGRPSHPSNPPDHASGPVDCTGTNGWPMSHARKPEQSDSSNASENESTQPESESGA